MGRYDNTHACVRWEGRTEQGTELRDIKKESWTSFIETFAIDVWYRRLV